MAQPQNIEVNVAGLTLNKLLVDLSERYQIQLAFDDKLLSSYKVSVMRNFGSFDEMLLYLLKGLPLKLEKLGDVFLIVPDNKPVPKIREMTKIGGQVVEAGSGEPLPYSYILINNKPVTSDRDGNFTFLASADTTMNLQISHLGYFIYDTVFSGSINQRFYLRPSVTRLGEIQVTGGTIERSALIGSQAGKIKLNHNIAPYLPGYGDNPIFNLLRLMPGVLAAGEHASDLLIWGSYESQSKVELDGFTLFGLKNYNDNIGAVNPLVLKDVEVFKAGYGAKYGDRVGGIVNITGKNGSLEKPSFTFNINNTTVNSLLEVPVSDHSSLLAAYRQTYYELYDPAKLAPVRRNARFAEAITLTPDYRFKDANLKYSFSDKKTNADASLYAGGDKFHYNMKQDIINNQITRDEDELNRQIGGSASLGFSAENGNSLKFNLSFSKLWNTTDEVNKTYNTRTGKERIMKSGSGENNVAQITLQTENRLNFREGHSLESGLGFEATRVLLFRKLFDETLMDKDDQERRIFLYAQDNLPFGKNMEVKTGVRVSYLPGLKKVFVEPKISASLNVSEYLKMNFAYGIYHQYLSKATLVDSTLNLTYFWAISDQVNIPVVKARHWVGGMNYNRGGFTASVEGYYKNTGGISRFINGTPFVPRGFYTGDARSYGIDFYLKQEYKNNVVWVSYTLSKTEEHFPYFGRDIYRPAPQDQRHEIKFAGILNFKSFYFSADYVYGSGFEKFILTNEDGVVYIPEYNRLDVALIYKFKPGRINCEAGISILNVMNTENIKLSNLRRVATGVSDPLDVYTDAVPFTPTLFLKVRL